MSDTTLYSLMHSHTVSEWHEVAAWLERQESLPLPMCKFLVGVRHIVGRGLYDEMRPAMDSLYTDDPA